MRDYSKSLKQLHGYLVRALDKRHAFKLEIRGGEDGRPRDEDEKKPDNAIRIRADNDFKSIKIEHLFGAKNVEGLVEFRCPFADNLMAPFKADKFIYKLAHAFGCVDIHKITDIICEYNGVKINVLKREGDPFYDAYFNRHIDGRIEKNTSQLDSDFKYGRNARGVEPIVLLCKLIQRSIDGKEYAGYLCD